MLAHDPGARRGDDPEELHQLRVTTRRLRAYLRAARPLLDESWAESLRAEARWLGSVLGSARDLDVLLERFRAEVAGLEADDAPYLRGLLDTLEPERVAAYAEVVDGARERPLLALLDRIEAAAAPPLSGEEVPLAKLWHREAKKMRQAFESLGDDSRGRRAARCPHPGEACALRSRPRSPRARRPGKEFVDAAKKVQDILGDHQDSVVAEERIRHWLETTPGSAFAAGRLVQLERDRRVAARAAWPKAWQRLDRAARRAAG